jgi:hypothetical protein
MSSKDNKHYCKVRVELAKRYKPSNYNTLYNNLMTIAYSTEDNELSNYIINYCNLISEIPNLAFKKMPQSINTCITNASSAKLTLDTYCQQMIMTQKPEWQIIAEKNGWRPSR